MKRNKPIKHPEGRGACSTLRRRITEKASKIHCVIFYHPKGAGERESDVESR